MLNRLFQNWAYATPPMALLLIGLYPFIGSAIALPLFLSLPVYMIHQYEEHDENRFAVFLNGMMGPGKRGLSPAAIWTVKFRKYNPGLWTSVFLFIPLAIWIFATVPAALSIHIVSTVLVIVLHAGIMIAARRPA